MQYTCDPIIDTGLCVLALLADKRSVAELDTETLDVATTALAALYRDSFIPKVKKEDKEKRKKGEPQRVQVRIGLFALMNTRVINGAKSAQDVQTRLLDMVSGWRTDEPSAPGDVQCAFFPHLKARCFADRSMYPFAGAGNTLASNGYPGVPMSGLALLASYAHPFGGTVAGGATVLLHDLRSGDDNLTFAFTEAAYRANRKRIALDKHMIDIGPVYRSRFIEWILGQSILGEIELADPADLAGVQILVYINGQSVAVDLYTFDVALLRFLSAVNQQAKAPFAQFVMANHAGPVNRLYDALVDSPSRAWAMLCSTRGTRCHPMIVNLYLQEVMNVDKTVQGMCATVAQAIASAGAGKKEYYTLVKARGNPSVWLTVLRTLKERDQRRGHPNMKAVATAIDALLRSRDWHVLSQYLLYLLVDHIDLSSGVEEEEADELTDELADDLELEFI